MAKELAMLVLSRKKDEGIVIQAKIKITVLEVRGDRVKLGIEAPADVPVHRQEVWAAINGTTPPTAAQDSAQPES